jgi:hypothetical protein
MASRQLSRSDQDPRQSQAKRRLGERLGSGATAGEGTQNLICAAQAAGVLLALVVVAVWPGGWPIDPIIALGIAAWSVGEEHRSWRAQTAADQTGSRHRRIKITCH